MWQKQPNKSSYRESIKVLEADIRHANNMAAALQREYGEECLQMRLSYSPYAPFFLFLMEWMDCSCTDTIPRYLGLLHILVYKVYVDGMTTISKQERKATLREFYAVIYPSLRQLEGDLIAIEDNSQSGKCTEVLSREMVEENSKLSNKDQEREDECGICMESWNNMVLPNCRHSMCISCFNDWSKIKQVNLKMYDILTSLHDQPGQKQDLSPGVDPMFGPWLRADYFRTHQTAKPGAQRDTPSLLRRDWEVGSSGRSRRRLYGRGLTQAISGGRRPLARSSAFLTPPSPSAFQDLLGGHSQEAALLNLPVAPVCRRPSTPILASSQSAGDTSMHYPDQNIITEASLPCQNQAHISIPFDQAVGPLSKPDPSGSSLDPDPFALSGPLYATGKFQWSSNAASAMYCPPPALGSIPQAEVRKVSSSSLPIYFKETESASSG
ncbi:hypothetical protein HHK36_029502 [Tetracentron sinense]|uniref:RING-type domain-containing protein n=1 Tax=Tetracentron sinense TaxID=13715 RepID=A0A834YFB4_TETSI|nr:hypothetical protein HHK36_029502 [Tetracentron sinense]